MSRLTVPSASAKDIVRRPFTRGACRALGLLPLGHAAAPVAGVDDAVRARADGVKFAVNLGAPGWFRNADGTLIDSGWAAAGRFDASVVRAGIRRSRAVFEDDDHDGSDDHGGRSGHGSDD